MKFYFLIKVLYIIYGKYFGSDSDREVFKLSHI